MEQPNAGANELSEDKVQAIDENENPRMVPVTESIRYRKRAQNAEQKVQQLSEQLEQANSQTKSLSEQLNELQNERSLTRKLAVAGASDIETALLVAKARLDEHNDMELDDIIEQVKNEKSHLFASSQVRDFGAAAPRTTPAKQRNETNSTTLKKAASKAANSGSREDLHQYLRLRRNFR